MAFTYDLSSSEGQIRLLLMDTNSESYVFEDAERERVPELGAGQRAAGAALALETMASNEAFVLKVIKLLDLQTDGARRPMR